MNIFNYYTSLMLLKTQALNIKPKPKTEYNKPTTS